MCGKSNSKQQHCYTDGFSVRVYTACDFVDCRSAHTHLSSSEIGLIVSSFIFLPNDLIILFNEAEESTVFHVN
jgi:hypothetical protein